MSEDEKVTWYKSGSVQLSNMDIRVRYGAEKEATVYQSQFLKVDWVGQHIYFTFKGRGDVSTILYFPCDNARYIVSLLEKEQMKREKAKTAKERFRQVVAELEMLTEAELVELVQHVKRQKGKSDD